MDVVECSKYQKGSYLQMKQVKLKFIVLDHVAQHNNNNINAFILNFWVWLHESFSSGC